MSCWLEQLYKVVASRQDAPPERSYTARMLAEGSQRIAQKVGEEAVEVLIEVVRGDKHRLAQESADLLYHLMVAWLAVGLRPSQVGEVLAERQNLKASTEDATESNVTGRTDLTDVAGVIDVDRFPDGIPNRSSSKLSSLPPRPPAKDRRSIHKRHPSVSSKDQPRPAFSNKSQDRRPFAGRKSTSRSSDGRVDSSSGGASRGSRFVVGFSSSLGAGRGSRPHHHNPRTNRNHSEPGQEWRAPRSAGTPRTTGTKRPDRPNASRRHVDRRPKGHTK